MILSEYFNYMGIKLLILLAVYVLVLVAISLDLWSGISKAKRKGKCLRSDGLQETTKKIGRYFNVLFIFAILDLLQMLVVFSFKDYDTLLSVPILPFFTFLVAAFLIFTEALSIYENRSDKKNKEQDKKTAETIGKVVRKVREEKNNF